MKIHSIFLSLIALLLTACGNSDRFSIEGTIEGGGGQLVELTYFSEGAAHRVTAVAEDGKFSIEGVAPRPALAFLAVSGNASSAILVVENGDELTVNVAPESTTWKASGNNATEALAKFHADNAELLAAGSDSAVNAAVAQFVGANNKRVAAAALMVSTFRTRGHERMADSLMALLSPEARQPAVLQNFMSTVASQLTTEANENLQSMALYERRDTTIRYLSHRQRYALFAFLGTERQSRDTIIPYLRAIADSIPERSCRVFEVSLAADSAAWKRSVAPDNASWSQVWQPGSVSSSTLRKLAVTRTPFFIIADSTGRQTYRGSSISEARQILRQRLKL